MAKTVKEVMNRELFSLRANDDPDQALGYILALGITAAPVLDESARPLGVASFRDLLSKGRQGNVAERMTVPAVTISETASIEAAAQMLAEHGVHRAIAVAGDGRAVGMVSALDVIRALLGLPVPHPEAFPHYDAKRAVSWTDDTLLELERVDAAPDGPGVLVLVSGGKDRNERVVWAEAANNVRTRLYDLLSGGPQESRDLSRIVTSYSTLRFRAASVPVLEQRRRIAESIMADVTQPMLPISAE